MEPSSQSKSWKRTMDPQEDEESQQRYCYPESKRARPDVGNTFHYGSASQSFSYPPPGPHPFATGHSYGPSDVHGNGSLQNGDAYYTAGPSSQIWGPSVLNGEMRVHLTNIFHNYNRGLLDPNTKDTQEQELKSLLYYSTMDDRKAQLKVVDPATFGWIWSQTAFPKWLVSDDGIFWISGRPASGKSTLINYLSKKGRSSEVLRHLERSGQKWLLVRFYFDFRAGTGIANTMLGMFRSLLLQLVEESTDIRDCVLNRCQYRLHGNWPELEAELLDLICEAVKSTSISICGFIDGLDEYVGSLWKLVDFLFIVQKRTGIKICLASRPESELLHRLRETPTFAMQDYNQGTIKTYIDSAVVDLDYFVPVKQLRAILEEEVLTQANGVILWAVFAVDEALRAALRGCMYTEIRQLIRSFPQELSSVYKRIWDKLPLGDQRLAATTLYVVQHWESSFCGFEYHVSLSSSNLFHCCRMILQTLDPGLRFDTDFSELYFRLKTCATLGGLVEFVGKNHEARLGHKSVQSFLEQSTDYARQVADIRQVVCENFLGPSFFAYSVIDMCGYLLPELKPPASILIMDEQGTGLRPFNCFQDLAKAALIHGLNDPSNLPYLDWGSLYRYLTLNFLKSCIDFTIDRVLPFVEFHNNVGQYAALLTPIIPRLLTRNHEIALSGFDYALAIIVRQAEMLNSPDWEHVIRILHWISTHPSMAKHLGLIWRACIHSLRDKPASVRRKQSRATIFRLWKSYLRQVRPRSVQLTGLRISNASSSS